MMKFIIIIGKPALYELQPSLDDSARLVYSIVNQTIQFSLLWISQELVFFFFISFFLQSKLVSLVSDPQSGGPDLCTYDPH
jgi:hypothetical protein